ncbi:transcription antitermination protein NusB [Acholeplasma granularum]|uniref:transcription antitermination protein NusB n=1 Tax=Acholeplasma granularum TaxID=264635 RepID=UPI00046EF705|nr:transcription antitermination factor NusB [Acholeplasma granularum]
MEKQTQLIQKRMEIMYQYALNEHLNFLDYLMLPESEQVYITSVISELATIDNLISSTIQNYTIDRLNFVDLSIIRLTVYELLKKETAPEIIMNTAIELTKEYSDLDDEKQHKFTNKLIDSIYKKIK